MVLDAPITDITIIADTAPHAYINGIRTQDSSTGIYYNLYPEGQIGHCKAGATLSFWIGVYNDGSANGTLYCKVTRVDTGAVLINDSFSKNVGDTIGHESSFVITMPVSNLTLRVEIGHL